MELSSQRAAPIRALETRTASPLDDSAQMRVLVVTSEWPAAEEPWRVPYLREHIESLRRLGVHCDVIHFRGRRRLSNYLRARRRVQRQIDTGRYDLVHAHWGQSALLLTPKRLPLVMTFHGSDLCGIVGENGKYTACGYLLRQISRAAAWLADHVIVVSRRLARYLPRGIHYDVVPVGVTPGLFQPVPAAEARSRLGLPPNQKLVLFAADPAIPNKRFNLAQSVVDRLRRESEVELVLTARVPHDQMHLYMSACDALLFTSRHEGSPAVVKEALLCGLPVVSVDVGDVRERVERVEGCYVGSDDANDLATGLADVLRRNTRVDGRLSAVALDHDRVAAQIVGIYGRILSGRGRAEFAARAGTGHNRGSTFDVDAPA